MVLVQVAHQGLYALVLQRAAVAGDDEGLHHPLASRQVLQSLAGRRFELLNRFICFILKPSRSRGRLR